MLKIRLARIGKKKQPYYRIIVSEKARDTYGKSLEILGSYNPRSKKMEVKSDRVKHWLSLGAQSSATMHNLLVNNNIVSGKKVNITHLKASKKAEIAKKEQKPIIIEKTEQEPVKTEPSVTETVAEPIK